MALAAQTLTPDDIERIASAIDRPIVLVGLMGSGKSTIGRRLAALLDRPFCDADDEIEIAAGMKVADIFETFGEPSFRDGERRVIARIMDEARGVVATGGGAFCDATTRALILQRGLAVWLDCAVPVLVERTARRDTRPLLKGGEAGAILERLYRERLPFYAEAPIRVRTSDGPHHRSAMQIIEAIDKWQ